MTRDELLAKATFSDQGLPIWRRVAETLLQHPDKAAQQNAKLLGLLIEYLERKEVLDASEIDDLLLELI